MLADSEQGHQAPERQTQHGGEGKAPHRAEAFVAMRRPEDGEPGDPEHQTGREQLKMTK